LREALATVTFPWRILYVENNSKRSTFLDSFGVDVLYTDTNLCGEPNNGNKELEDIRAALTYAGIRPDDFVVKITGRYSIHRDSPFLRALYELTDQVLAIVRYGSFMTETAPATSVPDVITGIIGLRAKYIWEIRSARGTPIEWEWGKIVAALPQEGVIALPRVGADMPIGSGDQIVR
jgi:hypothetical protein